MPQIFEPMTLEDFKPRFEIVEDMTNGLGDKAIGQNIQAIINYTVVEKTKTFTILRVDSLYLLPSARKF